MRIILIYIIYIYLKNTILQIENVKDIIKKKLSSEKICNLDISERS